MKKKIKISLPFKVSYDAPVTLTFVFLTLILYSLNVLVFKNNLDVFALSTPTKVDGEMPFEISKFRSYLKMFLYIFGGKSWLSLICNLIFILLLGPSIEENYGSIIIGLMILVSAVFSGVLNACFCTVTLRGPVSVIFMLIFLNAFISFSKKKVPLTFIVVFVLYIFFVIFDLKSKGFVENDDQTTATEILLKVIICVTGGLCGSLFAFLASPKSRKTRKANKDNSAAGGTGGLKTKAEYLSDYSDENSPRFKNQDKENDDDGSTYVGTIKFD